MTRGDAEAQRGSLLNEKGVSRRDFLKLISGCENLSCHGLMTLPPWFDQPERVRPFFSGLRSLRDSLLPGCPPHVDLEELSMGMSGDYEVAIEEGATLVRIGTALFGPRQR